MYHLISVHINYGHNV